MHLLTGLIVAVAQLALPAPATIVQGERLHAPAGTGHVIRTAGASGGRSLALTGRGRARGTITLPAPAQLAVVARGHGCRGAPRLAVEVDGRRVLSRPVTSRRFTTLRATTTIPAGALDLAVGLINPMHTKRCTRRLDVDALRTAPAPAGRWAPGPRTTFQWQLSGTLDLDVPAEMYDIDLFDTPPATVAALHARGRHVACYLDAGTLEPGRPDAHDLPAEVVGQALPDWPDERWLDVRRLDILGPWLEHRMDLCRQKGFDAVEADNVDAYTNDSGFPLTAADQLRFNRFLADAAHARGLSIGLKNDLDQAAALEPSFDWALVEQCFQYDECDRAAPFTRAGKAVFVVEYERDPSSFCAQARAAGLMAQRKHVELDAWRDACW